MDLAIEAAIASTFKLSGQRCVSSGRMIVQRGVYDEFCKRFEKRLSLKLEIPSNQCLVLRGVQTAWFGKNLFQTRIFTMALLLMSKGLPNKIYEQLGGVRPKS